MTGRQAPRLIRDATTGQVLVVTRYHLDDDGTMRPIAAFDVTTDFDDIARTLPGHGVERIPRTGWGQR